jgi:uncharacterized protein (DUF58 family)
VRGYRLTFPLRPRGLVGGRPFGTMRSRRRGPGWDVAGSRPYRPGDDVRRLDWRASARLSSARGSAELVVREDTTEEATGVVVVLDRRPSMSLFPPDLPWLRKPAAVAEAGALIAESASHARCPVGYLGPADPSPSPPGNLELGEDEFDAPEDSLAASLARLASAARLPPGGFVFVLSDFLAPVPDDVWRRLLFRRWDLVPVVIQDPLWEQSFPDVAGAVLPLAEPSGRRPAYAVLDQAEVTARRRANENRLSSTLDRFRRSGLDWVMLSRHDPPGVVEAFHVWADGRERAASRSS